MPAGGEIDVLVHQLDDGNGTYRPCLFRPLPGSGTELPPAIGDLVEGLRLGLGHEDVGRDRVAVGRLAENPKVKGQARAHAHPRRQADDRLQRSLPEEVAPDPPA
ncbi:hypothetical protein GCM10027161_31580 [Microbispora hainanensis]